MPRQIIPSIFLFLVFISISAFAEDINFNINYQSDGRIEVSFGNGYGLNFTNLDDIKDFSGNSKRWIDDNDRMVAESIKVLMQSDPELKSVKNNIVGYTKPMAIKK